MFGHRFRIFRLFGFDIFLDVSWFFLVFLIVWTLATGVFPHYYAGLGPATYWLMGTAGAFGLFASIVLHECAHAVVARRFGIPMHGITLFIFGGVAEMGDEPPSAKSEFFTAIAGPLASVAIAGLCFGIAGGAQAMNAPLWFTGVVQYLGWINAILVLFNMVPAFPLDGGRVLRSALWAAKGNLRWATRVSAAIGSGFAVLLMMLGLFRIFSGDLIGGIWWVIMGMFIRSASQSSYQQVLLRRALEGEPVRRFMNDRPFTVPPNVPLRDFIDNFVYRHHLKMFPVVRDGDLLGSISVDQVKAVPQEEWDRQSVQAVMAPANDENTIAPGADAMDALKRMSKSGKSRLLVVEDGRLAGIISLRDLLGFLALRLELEGDS